MSNIGEFEARQGEEGNSGVVRSDRFIQKDGYWYYSTREGVYIGPFDDKSGAIGGCCEFIDYVCSENPGFAHTLKQYLHMGE